MKGLIKRTLTVSLVIFFAFLSTGCLMPLPMERPILVDDSDRSDIVIDFTSEEQGLFVGTYVPVVVSIAYPIKEVGRVRFDTDTQNTHYGEDFTIEEGTLMPNFILSVPLLEVGELEMEVQIFALDGTFLDGHKRSIIIDN